MNTNNLLLACKTLLSPTFPTLKTILSCNTALCSLVKTHIEGKSLVNFYQTTWHKISEKSSYLPPRKSEISPNSTVLNGHPIPLCTKKSVPKR
jgi:hypothetical protein